MESKTKTNSATERNSENFRSRIDVTTRLSPVSLLARFCNPLEVKFHVFRRLKRGEEKLISIKKFSIFLPERHVDSIKKITKKNCHIHFKKKSGLKK